MRNWIKEGARLEFKSNRSTGESSFFIGWVWIAGIVGLIIWAVY